MCEVGTFCTLQEGTVPSGGNVMCLEGPRQQDSREAIMQHFKQSESAYLYLLDFINGRPVHIVFM